MKKSYIPRGKRGSFGLDILLVIIVGVMAFFLVTMVVHKVYTPINEELQDEFSDNDDVKSVLDTGQKTLNGFDYLILTLMIGLFITMLISVVFLPTHPVFFIITIILLIILLLVSFLITDIWTSFSEDSNFANETATYSISGYIFNNLPLFVLIMAIIVGVLLYAKATDKI